MHNLCMKEVCYKVEISQSMYNSNTYNDTCDFYSQECASPLVFAPELVRFRPHISRAADTGTAMPQSASGQFLFHYLSIYPLVETPNSFHWAL